MNTAQLIDKLKSFNKEGGDSVILYRLPFTDKKVLQLGNAMSITKFDNKVLSNDGFIIHPFNSSFYSSIRVDQLVHYTYQGTLSGHVSELILPIFDMNLKDDKCISTSFEEYQQQFEKMFHALSEEGLNKIILSRLKATDSFEVNNVIDFFDELCTLYAHAFVYAIVTPQTGVWIGAGPELLLGKTADQLQTVSLAGTLPNMPESEWSKKELVEQKMVTDYMKEVLEASGIDGYKTKGPYTVEAGQVKHLRTDFSFTADKVKGEISDLLMKLHPTPAVCGLPKQQALEVIAEVESNRREYYAGFLGPVNNSDFSFFVNIRCLKLTQSHAALYLGGGLTRGSELKKEWEETELKGQTLLSVLKNVANLQGYE
ncbi:isochorismate synthase [Carboxylicivirga linearis]|uniref:isochorismate synthase n=1 Tax=Carboxylicivirga linearis TaxID=1628157 RepID=A0ABS5JUF0_9BACT|nr:isochorismate synthase [Carboxylicivirga linearis]MBS2098520.1 isochorismate synthase [Carboxylicivirga linearis]